MCVGYFETILWWIRWVFSSDQTRIVHVNICVSAMPCANVDSSLSVLLSDHPSLFEKRHVLQSPWIILFYKTEPTPILFSILTCSYLYLSALPLLIMANKRNKQNRNRAKLHFNRPPGRQSFKHRKRLQRHLKLPSSHTIHHAVCQVNTTSSRYKFI